LGNIIKQLQQLKTAGNRFFNWRSVGLLLKLVQEAKMEENK
jgi:hypothetical protein